MKHGILILVIGSLMPITGFAYLDPGTGSMMLQLLLGGVAAVSVALKMYWYKVRRVFGLGSKADPEDETT